MDGGTAGALAVADAVESPATRGCQLNEVLERPHAHGEPFDGLGERRAQAVKQILLLRGASAAQLSTVSYGEERPAVLGSDEEAMSLNRRVEIVYVR